MVAPDKSFTFWSVGCQVRRRFKVFLEALEVSHGVKLPLPTLAGTSDERLSSFKLFCSAMLERRSNCWSDALRQQSAGARTRMSIAHSLFLFRKLVPGKKPDVLPLFEHLTSDEPPEPDQKFMDFLRRRVPQLLPRAWDRGYVDRCLSSKLPTKACYQRGFSLGGSRGEVLSGFDDPDEARQEFLLSVLTRNKPAGQLAARLRTVLSSGKWRNLSIPSVEMNELRPFHETLYNYLGRYDWLLRGEATPQRFSDFLRVDGEVFVSGDYESATDNLNPHVQKEILRLILCNAVHIPSGIRHLAMRSLSLDLEDPRCSDQASFVRQINGQLMGNLVSFPLLCLVNYLTFEYVLGPNIPVRINGDDIVFRSTPDLADKWFSMVKVSGLKLSKGKTLVDSRFFTLNSAIFHSSRFRVRALPFIRSRALFGVSEDDPPISSLDGRFRSSFPHYFGRRRVLLRAIFLRENSGWINKSCRSLSRGLGIPVQSAELKESGLWARELRYLSLPSERKPMPTFSRWASAPDGFELCFVDPEYKRSSEGRKALQVAFIDAAWKPPSERTMEQYMGELTGCVDLSDRIFLKRSDRLLRQSKLLGLSVPTTRCYLRSERVEWRDGKLVFLRSDAWERRPTIKYRLDYLPIGRPIVMHGPLGTNKDYTVTTNLSASLRLPSREGNEKIEESTDGMDEVKCKLFPPPEVY